MTRLIAVVLSTFVLVGCSSGEPQPEPAHGSHDHGSHDHGAAPAPAAHDHSSHDHGAAPAAPAAHDHSSHDHGTGQQGHGTVAIAHDPMCGMKVSPSWTLFADEGGQRFPFCAEGCKARFLQNPHANGQAYFDKHCACKTTMEDCDCSHCKGAFEPCPCGA